MRGEFQFSVGGLKFSQGQAVADSLARPQRPRLYSKRLSFLAFVAVLCLTPFTVGAQEQGSLDWNLEDLFSEPPLENQAEENGQDGISVLELVRQPGFAFDGNFEFLLGTVPGYDKVPWADGEPAEFSWAPLARMNVSFNIEAQFSNILRLNSTLNISVPDLNMSLGDFYFDYNIAERVFFRGGRFGNAWGISPNFPFTNLLARIPIYRVDEEGNRVPTNRYNNDPLLLRINIPVGVGGFQFLGMSRVAFFDGERPQTEDFAYGGKYNLALRWIDLDVGTFFQENMPLRAFLSLKTTLGSTELYNEWLVSYDWNLPSGLSWAGNMGFVQSFFRDSLTLNGEIFYNTEENTFWYEGQTDFTQARTSLFPHGLNLAMNVLYRLGSRGPRIFVQTLYAPESQSAQLVPGFRQALAEHLEFYFAVPMALGNPEGYYYTNTPDPQSRNRPFTVVLMFSLRGNLRIAPQR